MHDRQDDLEHIGTEGHRESKGNDVVSEASPHRVLPLMIGMIEVNIGTHGPFPPLQVDVDSQEEQEHSQQLSQHDVAGGEDGEVVSGSGGPDRGAVINHCIKQKQDVPSLQQSNDLKQQQLQPHMGRIQCKGKGKGISSTVTPFKRRIAKWVTHTPKTITELIVAMAKKGVSPSQIGVVIRDKEAVPSTKLLTGQKITRLLKKNGCAPEIPEDIHCMIRKAISIRKHLEKSKKDKDAKYRLILIESRIHRLARYYRKTQRLPAKWKYDAKTASALVSA